MKIPLRFLFALLGGSILAGCGHVDLTPEGNPDRAVQGTVIVRATLPAGAQVFVRVLDRSQRDATQRPNNDLPIMDRPRTAPVERVLGEQTITLNAATSEPVPFRVEYNADDATLRRGLNIEARVSVDGKVRYRTINQHVLTLASAPYKHEVTTDPVQ